MARCRLINFHSNDIPYDVARNAHSGTSHTPEKRARQVQDEYVGFMAELTEEFEGYATAENRAEIAEALEQFRQGYIKRRLAHLHAKSRCISVLVTGPSNFPTRRNERANNTERKRSEEWLAYTNKQLDKLRRIYDPRRRANAPISSDEPDAIEQLQAKIEAAEKTQEYMKAANKIVRKKGLDSSGKLKLLKEQLGMDHTTAASLLTPDFMGRLGYPPYALSNNNANIRRMRQRIAELEKEAARAEAQADDGSEPVTLNGGTIIENFDENRLQIVFDEKPPADVRQRLKSNGFRWAPSQGAWQRKLNDNARWAAKRALGD